MNKLAKKDDADRLADMKHFRLRIRPLANPGKAHGAPASRARQLFAMIASLLFFANAVAQDGSKETMVNEKFGNALSQTPLINDLLVQRNVPVFGGHWGLELYVDGPLNSEPPGASWVIRKARFGYLKDLTDAWRLRATANYNEGGGLEFDQTYLSYSGWDRKLLKLGIIDPAFGLAATGESSGITFMEDALPVEAIAGGRSTAVSLLQRSPERILNAALVLFNVSEDNLREDGQGINLRYARAPIVAPDGRFMHLGASVSYRWNANASGTQFRTRPEIHTINDFYVDTGEISGASEIGRVNLSAAQVNGRFSWQGELIGTRVTRTNEPSVDFHGAYFFVSWFLTNDQRNYDFGAGKFDHLKVNKPLFYGGKGAFELAARISHVNLSDQDIVGGKETNISLGFNWYANNQFRLMTNLIKVLDVDRPGSSFDGLDPLSLSLRVQWTPD